MVAVMPLVTHAMLLPRQIRGELAAMTYFTHGVKFLVLMCSYNATLIDSTKMMN